MRFTASPLVVAVALGLLHPSVLVDEAQARARTRAPRAPSSVETVAPRLSERGPAAREDRGDGERDDEPQR